MTVSTLIDLLQKVEPKEAEVFLENSEVYGNAVTDAIIEHDLLTNYIAVILKKGVQ